MNSLRHLLSRRIRVEKFVLLWWKNIFARLLESFEFYTVIVNQIECFVCLILIAEKYDF